MATHTQHNAPLEVYFCTFTCYRWLPLFEQANAYSSVYRWFEHLKKDDCLILGYVIMPNHVHCLLYPTHSKKPLNLLVGEGKRFMAYSIVNALRKSKKSDLLNKLKQGVTHSERRTGKLHQVFRLSFHARVCFNEKMLEQKLDYIHHNPVSGKWRLVDDFAEYLHSSAAYYETGTKNTYLTHYKEV